VNKYIVLGILAAVLISGCTGTNVTSLANEGVIINLFDATPDNVLEGDSVIFDMEVENVGGTTANNVEVALYGVQDQWRGSNDDVLDDIQSKFLGSLRPPIEARSIPGDFRLSQWQLITPDLPQGIDTTLPVTARVTYDYNTSGFIQITAVSEQEYQQMQIRGDVPNVPTVVNSNGPLKLDAPTIASSQFIILNTQGDEEIYTHPFRFVLTNVGAGFPVTEEIGGNFIGAGGRLKGTLEVLGPGVSFYDCLGVQSTGSQDVTVIDFDEADILPRVRTNNQANIACTIQFDLDEWGDRPEDTVMFVFNIFYTYFTDNQVSVRVTGR